MQVSLKKTIFILVNIALIITMSVIFSSSSILCMGLIFLILPMLFSNIIDDDAWIWLSLISLCMYIMILLVYFGCIHDFGSPFYSGGSDDKDFETYAKMCVDNGYIGPLEIYKHFWWYNSVGYVWILSDVMRISSLFGKYHTIIPRILNGYSLLCVAILSGYIYKRRVPDDSAGYKKVLVLTGAFPNALYISSFVFRDPLFLFFLMIVLKELEDLFSKNTSARMWKYVLICIFTFLATFIRTQGIIYAVAFIIFKIMFYDKQKTGNKVIVFGICIVVALIGGQYLLQMVSNYTDFYSDYMLGKGNGLSDYIWSMPILPFGVFARFFYGLASPFPNAILNIYHVFRSNLEFVSVIIAIFVIFQILLLPYLFKAFTRLDDIVFSFLIVYLSVVISTFTFRHFLLTYPFMWILILRELYLTDLYSKRKIDLVWFFLVAMMACIYVLLV